MGKGQELYNEAKSIIPGGTQLLSKRPEMWLPDYWPSYYSKAKGCEVWDIDDNHYYDMSLMGVGSNVLGYAFEEVDDAAKDAIDRGGMCTLNAPEEVTLAKELLRLHPWADMVRYAKAGGEIMAVATRIARAHTGRDRVLVCGYHGWHDWYLSANLVDGDPLSNVHLKGLAPSGVPKGLAGSNLIFHYNSIDEFNNLMDKYCGEIAAVIMEPIRNDEPKEGFLQEIRRRTKEEDVVLIFDEISSGFRLCPGGAHLVYGVEPDMASFAKGMTNGYPVSALIGRQEVMQAAQDTFISSTFWTERIALAAAVKSIECYEKYNVHEVQKHVGEKIKAGWSTIREEVGVDYTINGILPMLHFDMQYDNSLAYKTYYTQEMLKKGFLASNAVYTCLAHTDDIIDKYLDAFREVMIDIKGKVDSGRKIEEYLVGEVCHSGFERLN